MIAADSSTKEYSMKQEFMASFACNMNSHPISKHYFDGESKLIVKRNIKRKTLIDLSLNLPQVKATLITQPSSSLKREG